MSKKRYDFRLEEALVKRVDKWCAAQKAKTTRTAVVESALELWLKTHPTPREKKR